MSEVKMTGSEFKQFLAETPLPLGHTWSPVVIKIDGLTCGAEMLGDCDIQTTFDAKEIEIVSLGLRDMTDPCFYLDGATIAWLWKQQHKVRTKITVDIDAASAHAFKTMVTRHFNKSARII